MEFFLMICIDDTEVYTFTLKLKWVNTEWKQVATDRQSSDGEKPGYFQSPGFGLSPGFEINYPGFTGLCRSY